MKLLEKNTENKSGMILDFIADVVKNPNNFYYK